MQSADSAQPQSSSPRHLRVFLASPGDVADERALALTVLEQLQYDPLLRGKITVETTAWDKPGAGTPMLATMTPQEAIKKGLPTPAECDIVIVIFWSRMGTPLPEEWKKPNGNRYLSGTEWEYLNALEAAEHRDKPAILVYRRTEKIALDPDDPDFKKKSQQWQLVKQFFNAFQNPDGSLIGGYNPYPAPEEFRAQLNLHLRSLVREILERAAPIAAVPPAAAALPAAGPPLWRGSPFPGLRAFTAADAPIFFGRGRETDGLVSKLADPAVRFLAVVGASGSGKSSLVAAGLIPRLMAGALPGSQDWAWVRFTPGEVGDNPFMGLALSFKDALQQRGRQPRSLAEQLEKNPAPLAELRDLALADKPAWAELLLFLDQFEELFTLVTPQHVGPFVDLLNQTAHTERIRVVATLRADFYHRCVEQLPLAELLRTGSYPLAAPSPGALHEMIIRPAERAGLTFEAGLVENILDDTGSEPGALALLAFALFELWQAKTKDGLLTQAAYERFKGVHGAIAKRAEDTVSQLGGTPHTLGEVFQELVEIEEGGTVTRQRAPWARLVKTADAERLVNAFINARLLVASRGEDGQAVVEVAHEALFTAWQTLRAWLDTHREQLKAGQDLEDAAQEWQAIGERGSGLALGTRLKRYRQAINPSPLASRFLGASQRRLWIFRSLAGFTATLVLAIVIGTVWLYANGLTIKHGTAMLLATVGLYRVDEPEMVKIPAGEFWMGSRDDDREASASEKPRHRVMIPRPFEIGKYEVTFAEYDQFAHATRRPLPADHGWGRGRRPVINVSWEEAVTYAAWLSKMTGKQYRLPSEAEWEYAVRASSEASRFWGDDPNRACQYANGTDQSYRQAGFGGEIHPCNDGYVDTAEVGSFKANGFGLHDMLGNASEWVQDSWHRDYQGTPADGSAWEERGAGPRVLRGGSWFSGPLKLRAAARDWFYPRVGNLYQGFRLAASEPRSVPSVNNIDLSKEPSKPTLPVEKPSASTVGAISEPTSEPRPVPSVENIHGWSAQQVQALQRQIAQALKVSVEFRDVLEDGSQGPVMVVIPGGRFLIGSPPEEPQRQTNEHQHEAEVAPFAMGKYEVTFEEYDRFAEATGREKPSDSGWGRGRRPVINVTWFDAMAYAEWLSRQTRQAYRLPTEAEWEYAGRAGTTTPFHFGTMISTDQANYNGNFIYDRGRKGVYRKQTVEAGQLSANAWGLHDVHGNVWEWTASKYDEGYGSAALRGVSDPDFGGPRVMRGGSWFYRPDRLRAATRYGGDPRVGDNDTGFRLARTL